MSLLPPSESLQALMDLNFNAVSIKYAGDDYGARNLHGSIRLHSSIQKGVEFFGNLTIAEFSYGFPGFSISKVNADLRDIEGRVDPKSNVNVKLAFDGKSILLEEDSIVIPKIASVKAPLVVKVPASGGYSVSGPVTVEGGKVMLLDRWKLSDVKGTVDLLVSEPLIDIKGNKIELISESEEKVLDMHYRLNSKEHIIDDTTVTFARGGTLDATANIKRSSGEVHGETTAKQIRFAELVGFLVPGTQMEDTHRLDLFDAKFTAALRSFVDSLDAIGVLTFTKEECGRGAFVLKLFDVVSAIPPFSLLTLKDIKRIHNCPGGIEFGIADKRLLIEKSEIALNRANLTASGTIGFDKQISVDAELLMAKESAAALGMGIGGLEKLFGAVAEVSIPIDVTGKLPDPSISIDKSALVTDSAAISLVTGTLGTIKKAGSSVGRAITGRTRRESQEDKTVREKRFQLPNLGKEN